MIAIDFEGLLCPAGVPINGVGSELTRLHLFSKLSSALAGIFTHIVQNVVIFSPTLVLITLILCTFGAADYTVRFRRPIGPVTDLLVNLVSVSP